MFVYFKLFRWPNLLIVAFTQYLFRYCIIFPLLRENNISLFFSDFEFFLLVLSTIMVTAGGYAINDYFDLRIDRINKPHKIILGRDLSRRKAILAHTILNALAFIIGLYLAYRVRYLPLAGFFVIVPGLLWLYSIRYKRMFLIGNVLVSIIAAFVIVLVWLFEYKGVSISHELNAETLIINRFLRVYVIFAFLTTFIREVLKDVEDIKGDLKTGCKTIPIVLGVRSSKRLIIVLAVILILFVGYFQIYLLSVEFDLIFAYLLFAVQIPLILFINKTNNAKEKYDYTINSRFAKFIMFTGIFSMFLFYFYL